MADETEMGEFTGERERGNVEKLSEGRNGREREGGRERERERERESEKLELNKKNSIKVSISLLSFPLIQNQLDHPHLHIQRVREFRFREILKPATERESRAGSAVQDREDLSSSVDNLVQVSRGHSDVCLK